jgi:hypothetical protein
MRAQKLILFTALCTALASAQQVNPPATPAVALSANTATNISGGAAGQIPVQSGAGATTFDPNFTWTPASKYFAIGAGAPATQLDAGNLVNVSDSVLNTLQVNVKNTSSAASSSGDFVVTMDTGTNISGFGNFGCNSSGYSQPLFSGQAALDCYMEAVGTSTSTGNLWIGTAGSATQINHAIGGGQAINTLETLSATNKTFQNPTPIIGATLTLSQAIRQTAQSFTQAGGNVTSVTIAGSTMTVNGTFSGGATNGYQNWAFTLAGFTNPGNNGTFICSSSTGSTLVFVNTYDVAETAPATASVTSSANTTAYVGTITGGNQNVWAGIAGIAGTGTVTVAGFSNGGNNGTTFVPIASTTTVLAVTNAGGVNETHAGTVQSTSVVNSLTLNLAANYGTGAGTYGVDKWSFQDVMGSVASNPTSTLTISHSGTSGVATFALPTGTIAAGGASAALGITAGAAYTGSTDGKLNYASITTSRGFGASATPSLLEFYNANGGAGTGGLFSVIPQVFSSGGSPSNAAVNSFHLFNTPSSANQQLWEIDGAITVISNTCTSGNLTATVTWTDSRGANTYTPVAIAYGSLSNAISSGATLNYYPFNMEIIQKSSSAPATFAIAIPSCTVLTYDWFVAAKRIG